MNITEFKTGLKQVADQLRGLTLQLTTINGTMPYKSLKQFGTGILSAEANGLNVEIKRAWIQDTNQVDEIAKPVTTFMELVELLSAGIVVGVGFETVAPIPASIDEYISSFGSLD